MLKKIILLLFCVSILSTGCGKKEAFNDDLTTIQQRGKIIVGVKTDTKPFGFYNEKGQIVGYDVDLAKAIASGLLGSESKLELIPVTASNRIMKLISNEIDILIATISVTEQREEILNFSMPYYIAGQAILVNQNSDITSLKQLAGKRIILVFGSTSEKSIRAHVPNAIIIGFKTYPEAFKALKNHLADAMIADDTILLGYTLSDNSVKMLPHKYSREPYAVAYRKSEESKILETKIDIIIRNLESTGKLNKLQEKWNIK